jgi:hypothetical protein
VEVPIELWVKKIESRILSPWLRKSRFGHLRMKTSLRQGGKSGPYSSLGEFILRYCCVGVLFWKTHVSIALQYPMKPII